MTCTQIDQIRDEQHARTVGTQWAYAHGYNPDQLSCFAALVYIKLNGATSTQTLHQHLQRFVEAKTATRGQWQAYADQEWKLRDDWILETVKHLALVNIAGLAGATALFASEKSIWIKVSIGLFGVGLLLAVVDLFINAKAHQLNGVRANALRSDAHSATSWDKLVTAATAKPSSSDGDLCTECAEVAGALSGILAVAGVILLVIHLT